MKGLKSLPRGERRQSSKKHQKCRGHFVQTHGGGCYEVFHNGPTSIALKEQLREPLSYYQFHSVADSCFPLLKSIRKKPRKPATEWSQHSAGKQRIQDLAL